MWANETDFTDVMIKWKLMRAVADQSWCDG